MSQQISIITPWLDCPELIPTYEKSVNGAEVIVIDNGSTPENAIRLHDMVMRLGGQYIRNDFNAKYAAANNQGMAVASGDILIFLNNDIEAPKGWLWQVERDVFPNALLGPSKAVRMVAGKKLAYIEGYCIAGQRATWERLKGWDAEHFKGMYWEDNDVCFRAQQMGMKLIQTNWAVWHYSNYTSGKTEGAYDHSQTNEAAFTERVLHFA